MEICRNEAKIVRRQITMFIPRELSQSAEANGLHNSCQPHFPGEWQWNQNQIF